MGTALTGEGTCPTGPWGTADGDDSGATTMGEQQMNNGSRCPWGRENRVLIKGQGREIGELKSAVHDLDEKVDDMRIGQARLDVKTALLISAIAALVAGIISPVAAALVMKLIQ